jgi:hypothetical protein
MKKGGPLVINHRDIRKLVDVENKIECKISYLRGMVSKQGEGLAGHHAAYTLIIGDESSGLENVVYDMACTWARRHLYIGNPNECQNWWRAACEAGTVKIDLRKPWEKMALIT